MIVTTVTGSVYEFQGLQVRRLGAANLRRDGEWIRLNRVPNIRVGFPMVLELEPLGECDVTFRFTSNVESCDGVHHSVHRGVN
jgi:hypothetical protein